MKRLGHIEDGHLLTAGEKALVVMLVAGVFGYWAGFNLSTPGIADPFPVRPPARDLPRRRRRAGSRRPAA